MSNRLRLLLLLRFGSLRGILEDEDTIASLMEGTLGCLPAGSRIFQHVVI